MKRKYHTPGQIIKLLRAAEPKLAAGQSVAEVSRQLGISEATYYNWRKQYGQMKLNQLRQLKKAQKENAQLKKLVADLSLDNSILKGALSGKY